VLKFFPLALEDGQTAQSW